MNIQLQNNSFPSYPKSINNLHLFQKDGIPYVIDFNADVCIEVEPIVWEILSLCADQTANEMIKHLGGHYPEQEIFQAFALLQAAESKGLFFSGEPERQSTQQPSKRPRLFIPMSRDVLLDPTYLATGVPIATNQILRSLARHADLYLMGEEYAQIDEGIYCLPLDTTGENELSLHFLKHSYDGIYLQGLSNFALPTALFQLDCPVVIRLVAPRGCGGDLINTILQLYACLRPFDAFCPSAYSVREFYSQFVLDLDAFQVVPNGVDTELFQPMDKPAAKQQVADLLGRPEIAHREIVGFFGRFQPEKGAGIFIQIAYMNPDLLFLVVVPKLGWYDLRELPPNLIYAGHQPREQLPLFLNAFDLHCFPTMVGEEARSLTIMESMACGVPPVVSAIADLPIMVGDAGLVVQTNRFKEEIGSFAGAVSPVQMSAAIQELLADEDRCKTLGQRARERALQFTWDATAQDILKLFQQLNLKKKLYQPALPEVRFVPHFSVVDDCVTYRSVLVNMTQNGANPLMFAGYPQTIEEGIALSLVADHDLHEIEAVLLSLCERERAEDILQRIKGFMEAMT